MDQPQHVRIVGLPRSRDAYAIRDFLQRRMIAYDWCELTSDADCAQVLGIARCATSGCRS